MAGQKGLGSMDVQFKNLLLCEEDEVFKMDQKQMVCNAYPTQKDMRSPEQDEDISEADGESTPQVLSEDA